MATRRRNAAGEADRAAANGRPSAAAPAARAAAADVDPGVPRWFRFYYSVLCGSILTAVAVWFIFFRVPYASHVSFDPLQPLPALVRKELSTFYQHHNASSLSASRLTGDAPSLRALLDFLVRFQHAGYFHTPLVESYAEHYTEAITEGWIAGVLEAVQLDQRAMDEVEQERKGVGSIPGGSRKLNERMARLVSPIVTLMDGGDTAVAPSGGGNSGDDAAPSLWSQLEPEHRMWFYSGLAHCHSSPCRLAKMQLVSLWRDRLALFPQHENKEQWAVVTQLFHPEAHESKLTDASGAHMAQHTQACKHHPPSATTLASLWLRFFGCGDPAYVFRIVDQTVLTGAAAYQQEKDIEVRAWQERKAARAEAKHAEEHEAAVKAAEASGTAAPTFRPLQQTNSLRVLPRSPTQELHAHYFNSLLYYAAEHPIVKLVVQQALQSKPQEKVLQRLASSTQIRNELKPRV